MNKEEYKKLVDELKNTQQEMLIKLYINAKIENERLKEQLKDAIISKFKIGQKVYSNFGFSEVYEGIISCIDISKYQIVKIEYVVKTQYLGYVIVKENEIFLTKEEAEQKLKELKGE